MSILLFGLVILGFSISLMSIPLVIRWARKTGFLDHPGPRKIHAEPTPYGGGLAVAAAVFIPAGLALLAAWLASRGIGPAWPESLAKHVPGLLSRAGEGLLWAGGGFVILFLGLADDRHKLGPGLKFAVQVLVAIGFVIGVRRLSLFWEGSMTGDFVGGAITVLWIVGITNAFNLLDHHDGISAGVAAIAALALGIIAIRSGLWFHAAVLATLVGALAGFLRYNLPPARIYLGDAGSLFIGYLLATLTVTFTFYTEGKPIYAYGMPLVVLSVPLFDTFWVMFIRKVRGVSMFVGDRNHLAHRLQDLGLSRPRTVAVVYAITLQAGLSSILLLEVDALGAGIILSQLLLTFVIITILHVRTRPDPAPPPG